MKQTLNGTHTKPSKKASPDPKSTANKQAKRNTESMSTTGNNADIQEGTRSDEQMQDTFTPQQKSSMGRDKMGSKEDRTGKKGR